MEQTYLFFVANKNIKDAKKIDTFRIKTFVFFAPLCVTLKNKIDSYLFVNLRSSCITDYVELGYDDKTLDAIFGNSARVPQRHYIQLQKEKSYKKVLEDNAAIVEFLRKNSGSLESGENEISLREILGLRDLLVSRFGTGKSDS